LVEPSRRAKGEEYGGADRNRTDDLLKVSKHLAKLSNARLIKRQSAGYEELYSLRHDGQAFTRELIAEL